MSAWSEWKHGYITDDEYRAAAERDAAHVVLIKSDGTVIYEDDYQPETEPDEWREEDVFEDDQIDEF